MIGWDNKSVKEHVENAYANAGEALELARSVHDELAELRALIEEKGTFDNRSLSLGAQDE